MATHVHIDMLGGIAGDMFLAAALDAGIVDAADIEAALSTLGVGDIDIDTERVRRGAISGTHIEFSGWDPAEESDHRHLSTILEMLEASGLDDAVKARAAEMFELLGRSESKIHDIPMERVHFHEVGALDSIFDFVAAAYIIEHAADTWSFGDIPTGCGTIEVDHGTMPVPAPATADLLKGLKIAPTQVEAELVTPTGATILRTLDAHGRLETMPTGTVTHSGYGAGTRDMDKLANVVRFTVLETAVDSDREDTDDVIQLSCDIDDMNPEQFAHVERILFERGALDVVRLNALMKKGRQGVRLSVLCRPGDRSVIAKALFVETTTFGIRVERVERMKLRREIVEVSTTHGAVRVKVGYLDQRAIKASPEYEDCADIARASGAPIAAVYADASYAAQELFLEDDK
ncbi:MAG: nickel pincer cofactor biosynthesis protein LarC [Myxococcota bacterium]